MHSPKRGRGKKSSTKRKFKIKGPFQFAPAPDPESIMGRVSAEDRARFDSQPDLQAFVRPLVPGEFATIRVASPAAMKTLTHVYVQRVAPDTIARMRIPITAERAAAFVEGETFDVLQLQAELAQKSRDATDDPFLLPADQERLNIVAAASGVYATFEDYPQLEHDQGVLQARARQLVELNVQVWPAITNDQALYTELFIPAFVFGYRLGEMTLREVTPQERRVILLRLRSMEVPSALFFIDQMIRSRMQDMGVQTVYQLLSGTDDQSL